ncbi:hypothetical protein HYQ46_007372 [Verticillium longisporum]|nr:hypothetical protein HYQ46_007372 [Verticillium longisporum]
MWKLNSESGGPSLRLSFDWRSGRLSRGNFTRACGFELDNSLGKDLLRSRCCCALIDGRRLVRISDVGSRVEQFGGNGNLYTSCIQAVRLCVGYGPFRVLWRA